MFSARLAAGIAVLGVLGVIAAATLLSSPESLVRDSDCVRDRQLLIRERDLERQTRALSGDKERDALQLLVKERDLELRARRLAEKVS
jgi:hypothetical protein